MDPARPVILICRFGNLHNDLLETLCNLTGGNCARKFDNRSLSVLLYDRQLKERGS